MGLTITMGNTTLVVGHGRRGLHLDCMCSGYVEKVSRSLEMHLLRAQKAPAITRPGPSVLYREPPRPCDGIRGKTARRQRSPQRPSGHATEGAEAAQSRRPSEASLFGWPNCLIHNPQDKIGGRFIACPLSCQLSNAGYLARTRAPLSICPLHRETDGQLQSSAVVCLQVPLVHIGSFGVVAVNPQGRCNKATRQLPRKPVH